MVYEAGSGYEGQSRRRIEAKLDREVCRDQEGERPQNEKDV
jgi:hypothetical protein